MEIENKITDFQNLINKNNREIEFLKNENSRFLAEMQKLNLQRKTETLKTAIDGNKNKNE